MKSKRFFLFFLFLMIGWRVTASTVVWDPSGTAGLIYRVWLSAVGAPATVIGATANNSFGLPVLTPGSYSIYVTAVSGVTNESLPSNVWRIPTPVSVVTGTVVSTNIIVVPPPPTNTTVFVQAEGGVTVQPMALFVDPLALGSGYVRTTTANAGTTTYLLTVPAGSYELWGRIKAPASNADSFFFSMDGGPEDVWGNESTLSPNWRWTKVTSGNPGPVKIFVLVAGTHTLRFRGRELGPGLDALYLTSNPLFTPP